MAYSYRLLDPNEEKDRKMLIEILEAVDAEFVPPLSKRYPSLSAVVEHYSKLGVESIWIGVFEGERPVGFISASLGSTGEGDALENGSAYVSFVCVHPGFRRRNLAFLLSTKLEAELKKADVESMFVRTWSTGNAVPLYEKLGFKVVRIVENERAPGIHGLYMKKELVP